MKVPRIRSERPVEDASGPPAGEPDDPVYDFARKRGWIAYGLHLAGGLGIFGVHRFYLGYRQSAKVQLALAFLWMVSIFSIGGDVSFALQAAVMGWYIADLFLIPGLLRVRNAAIAELVAAQNAHGSASAPTGA